MTDINTGFIQDSFDPNDVFLDEVLSGEPVPLPPSYVIEGLPYEPQGDYPFCVSFAVSTMLEWHYNRLLKSIPDKRSFSQPHLFIRSGGSRVGSTFRNNLNIAKDEGCIPYTSFPMPSLKYGSPDSWLEDMQRAVKAFVTKDVSKLAGYARVTSSPESLKAAVIQHGPILVGVAANREYSNGNAKRTKTEDNHAILLVGWTPTHWIIFDSLYWVRNTAGYGKLNIAYTFNSAYVVTELPEGWKEIRDEVRTEPFQNALNHYGLRRNFEEEQRTAVKLLDELKAFKNQSVLDAAGRFWSVLINAATYGGYSISYRKFGLWQPGDLINFLYQYRRTGEFIFDLDKPRAK